MKLTRQAVRVIKQSIFRLLISMLNTADLSIKVACFVKKSKYCHFSVHSALTSVDGGSGSL